MILLLLLFILGSVSPDELISTRCQAQCLHLMDQRLQNNMELRKTLKHHIIQLCKEDATCSACSAPCREQFDDIKACKKSCVASDDRETCEDSCHYLQRIYQEKPGACPSVSNQSNYECSALCQMDGECPETQKCCSSGCSRQCLKPRSSDIKLLPIPRNISVQERKRKRSIIIRWATGRLSKAQQNENANLFLVQWRWGLHADESAMTEWQTVTVRNKPYAILKHLLSPGRFYEFRTAAVSQEGSLGFSSPSKPFKISKEAKAPPPPKDLSLGASKVVASGLWNQMVHWNPPPSDLPIKNYQISWASSTKSEADAFEEQMRKKSTLEFAAHEKRSLQSDDDEEFIGIQERDRQSVVVPSHATSSEITGLFPNSVYLVEIHASVDSSDGELHGEKGVVFIRTADSLSAVPEDREPYTGPKARIAHGSEELKIEASLKDLKTSSHAPNRPNSPQPAHLEIQTPFFDTELQTQLNWLNAAHCTPAKRQFSVKVRKTLCREYQPNHHSDTRWHDLRVTDCSALLKGLSFDCDYKVEVTDTLTGDFVVDGVFSTDTCDQTSSLTPIDCSSVTTPIQCQVTSESSAHCHWTRHHDAMQTVIGYRILLSSPINHDTNTTINQPQLREVRYENLAPGYVYTVEVQSITNKGLGRTVSTQFVTHPDLDSNAIQRFPGGEIIELPLESSGKLSIFSIFSSFFLVLLLRLL
ncbi:WAP-type 'four-disulfide core [Caenorhabditis elegans]|uniref:WAP-type 'four-disulfide core n=1 Tax=Caenorhabditis elegans TaxID=6239 RepID=G5EDX1_CAEEL|nr:WAP-type 'four-disulfide core [Caenorhabditis elegans]CAB04551.2 WAP-type 'four-disulfide core [Caenorhabditis elegans]|eukprot:NP_493468.2 human KALlmann syndrome homolog [Caenorhabditis elegans]